MEDWAELSPTSDSDAPGPSEPVPGPVPDSDFLGFMTALSNRLAATTSVLAATAAVAERPGPEGPPAGSESLPSMPSRIAAAKAFATPGLTSPDRPDATAATPGPGPTNPGPAPTNPDASSPLAAAKAKMRPTPKPKVQAGLYVAQNDNVGQFKRQNVTPEQRHELDRRNRKEQRRRERRAAERH